MRFAVEKNLPNEYTKLEYLESTGTQWIDTGIKSCVNISVKTKFNLANVSAMAVFGSFSGSATSGGVGVFFATAGGNISGKVYCNNTNIAVSPDLILSANTNYEIEISGTSLILNNSEYTAAATADNNYNMLLFARSNNGNVERNISGKIYYYKAYNNGTLVRDFIPALRKSDNVAGMYDRVTNTFFTNAGTGSFLYIKEEETVELLNNPKYKQVEYLESTGTQYIDTGIYLTNNHSVEIDYQLTSTDLSVQARKGLYGGLVTSRHGALLSPTNRYLEAGYGEGNDYYQIGMPDTSRHVLYQKKNELYFDGALAYTFATATFTQASTAPLGNFNYTNYNPAHAKYYSSRWWDGDTLIRNFIPAIRKEDNKPGMYDTVSGTFFENKGTGEFLTGRILDPLPAKYEELAYVESTGTQYIDTGVNFDCARTAIEVKTYETSLTQRHSILGDNENNVYYFRGTGNWAIGYNGTPFDASSHMILGDNTFKLDKNNLYLNGNLVKTYIASTNVSSSNILLFNRKTPAVDTGPVSMYYCRIWNDGILIRDFVPCIRKSDNKVSMYDRVNGGFYTNLGTGNFTGIEKSRQKEKTVRLVKTVSNGDLPYGLTEVEYLESTGTQWIDTEYTPTSDNFKYEGNIQASVGWFFGYRSVSTGTTTGDMRAMFVYPDGRMAIRYGAASDNSTLKLDSNKVCKVFFDGTSVYVDDVNFVSVTERYNNPVYKSMYLFAANATGYYSSDMTMFNGKIYNWKIWDDDTLVRDFVPVLDKSNVPCMYDKVSKKCFYNKGTGSFTAGRKIYPVEYLESTNQQNNQTQTTNASWIDTGIIPTSSTKMECKTQFTTLISGTNTEALFGTTGSGGNPRFAFGYASVSPYHNFYVGLGAQNLTTSVVRDTNVHTFIIDAQNNSWSIDDTTGTFTSAGTLSNTNPICLFGRHTSDYDGINKPANAKTYYCKIWDNDILTRDFIPAMDENQVGFMFDKVTHTIYDNKGTGTFSCGDKINPFTLRLIEDVS